MNPDKTSAIGLFNSPRQYVVPVFQRGYVWTIEKQVGPLWLDIEERASCWLERKNYMEAGSPSLPPLQKHFLGSIVLSPIVNSFNRVLSYEVIDGQQRTTTLHILLLAFRQAALQFDDPTFVKILDGLVRNDSTYKVKSDEHKVWPTKAGREEIAFLDDLKDIESIFKEYPASIGKKRFERPLMIQAYLYLYYSIISFLAGRPINNDLNELSESSVSNSIIHSVRRDNVSSICINKNEMSLDRAEALYMSLQDAVQIMTLTLEGEDDPQVIFETLNARGEPLLASDLIRNFIFLNAARNNLDVNGLYEKYWQNFDEQIDHKKKITANLYWREAERSGRINYPRIGLFFFHYTVMCRRQETKFSHVFQSFKEWWQSRKIDSIDQELSRIITHSNFFKELVSPEGNNYLSEFSNLIKALDVSTVAPVYLYLREYYQVDDQKLKQAVHDLSSYLVRRAVCGLTTKSYNRTFLRMLDVLDPSKSKEPADALREYLLGLGGASQIWPSDEMFLESWDHRPVYLELRSKKTAAILRAIEVYSRSSWQESQVVIDSEKLSVEHVLPREWESKAWYPLSGTGEDSKIKRNQLLHTFGNLTLLTQGLNSSISNGPFLDQVDEKEKIINGKRSEICGQSLLKMNAYFQNKEEWSDFQIRERSKFLSRAAIKLWGLPR